MTPRDANECAQYHRPANLGTGLNINSPNGRRRSARRAHRPLKASASDTPTPCLAERLLLLDFRTGGLAANGSAVGSTAATCVGAGEAIDDPDVKPSLFDEPALFSEAAGWY